MARNPSPPPDLSAEESALLEATLNPVALVATLRAVVDELQRLAELQPAKDAPAPAGSSKGATAIADPTAANPKEGEGDEDEGEEEKDSVLVAHLCTLLEATSLVGRATDVAAVEKIAELVPPVMMAVLEQADDDRTVVRAA